MRSPGECLVPVLTARTITSLNLGGIALRAVTAIAYAVMLLPIVFICWLSFFKNELLSFPPEGYTLRWFSALWLQSQFAEGFVTSLEVGLVAMVGGLVLGIPASLGLARRRFRGKEALATFLTSPLIVPSIVIGTALYIFFIQIEIATEWPLTGSIIGLALAHILVTIPWTVRLLTASLEGLDPSLEEAAMNLGADRWRTLIRVTLPVIRPAVVAAALFSFVVSFGNLEISLFLVAPGTTTLPIAILQYLEWKIDPTIAAISLVQVAIIAGGMVLTNRFVRLSQVI
jgi:putative spermidine/putrescine transport system permease protein